MTTRTKTAECQRTRKKIDLVCVCGAVLNMEVTLNGWFSSACAFAHRHGWKVCDEYDQGLGRQLDGYCPQCHKR